MRTNNTTHILHCDFSSIYKGFAGAFLQLVSVLGITENLFFCICVLLNRVLRKKSMVLIVSLSITDIIISLVVPQMEFLYTMYFPDWPLGSAGTDLFNSAWMFAIVSQFTTVSAITVERYLAITKPSVYRQYWTTKLMAYLLLLLWFYPMGWVLIMFYTFKPIKSVKVYQWNVDHALYYAFIWLHLLLPMMVIPLLYFRIYRQVRASRQNMNGLEDSKIHTKNVEEVEVKLSATVARVITALYVIWIPVLFLENAYTWLNSECDVKKADVSNVILVASNSCINPFLYSYRNPEMIKCFKKVRGKLCLWCNGILKQREEMLISREENQSLCKHRCSTYKTFPASTSN